ncbi:hypothetical protein [Streptomyces sp. NPDC048845]|uniref:hypothetical protein n=1 Tax=Streptomyces sp. NPDC048845 TaxID=3155390 RepID=UPI0034302397
MTTLTEHAPSWRPPDRHEWQLAGVVWDVVQAPDHLADRALPRLNDDAVGAVWRDHYKRRMYWMVPSGTAGRWTPLPYIEVHGRGARVEIPPAGLVRGLGPHWVREPEPGRLLTDPEALHESLSMAHRLSYDPWAEERR